MHLRNPYVIGIAAFLLAGRLAMGEAPVQLFDGKSLAGWDCFLVTEGTELSEVWSVRDGAIVCKGTPFGYLYTTGRFASFRLVVEWRWAPGTKPGNSGVLLRIQDRHRFLPKCVEAQLQSGSAGDVWAFGGATCVGSPARTRKVANHKTLGDFVGVAKMRANERPAGEWNRYEITLDGELLSLVVNGEQVNLAAGIGVAAGPIGLQSEGGEIHFRKVELTPLP